MQQLNGLTELVTDKSNKMAKENENLLSVLMRNIYFQ